MKKQLSDKDIRNIRARAALGVPASQIHEDYPKVTLITIRNVIDGTNRPEAGGLIRGRDYEGRRA